MTGPRLSAAEYLDRVLSERRALDPADPGWRAILQRTTRRIQTYISPLSAPASFRPSEAALVVDVLHPLLEALEPELAASVRRGEELLAVEGFVTDERVQLRLNEEIVDSEARLRLPGGYEASLAAFELWPGGLAHVQAVTWPETVRMAVLWLRGVLFAWTARQAYAHGVAEHPELGRWMVSTGARAAARRAAWDRLTKRERTGALWVSGIRSVLEGDEGSCLEGLVVRGGVVRLGRPHDVGEAYRFLDEAIGTANREPAPEGTDFDSMPDGDVPVASRGKGREPWLVPSRATTRRAALDPDPGELLDRLAPRLPRKQRALLTALRGAGSIAEAARGIGMNEQTARRHFAEIRKHARSGR